VHSNLNVQLRGRRFWRLKSILKFRASHFLNLYSTRAEAKHFVSKCSEPASEVCLNRLAYLLTPWRSVLPEQLVKKFPAFHGTRRFITALTSVRHLPLPWASPIQSTYPHPTSWRSILILSTHLASMLHNSRNISDRRIAQPGFYQLVPTRGGKREPVQIIRARGPTCGMFCLSR